MKWRERNSTTSGAKDLELGFDGLHKVSHPILGVGVWCFGPPLVTLLFHLLPLLLEMLANYISKHDIWLPQGCQHSKWECVFPMPHVFLFCCRAFFGLKSGLIVVRVLYKDEGLDGDENLQKCGLARNPTRPIPRTQQAQTDLARTIEIWIEANFATSSCHEMNRWWNLRIICKKSMQNKSEASIKPSTKWKSQSFSPVSECPQTSNYVSSIWVWFWVHQIQLDIANVLDLVLVK